MRFSKLQNVVSSEEKSQAGNNLQNDQKVINTSFWPQKLFTNQSYDQEMYTVAGEPIHRCVINDRNTLVYPANLADRNPLFYAELLSFAELQGCDLLADRRQADVSVAVERRRQWLPIFVLSLGLSSGLLADDQYRNEKLESQVTLGLFNSGNTQSIQTSSQPEHTRYELTTKSVAIEDALDLVPADIASMVDDTGNEIEAILRQHYAASVGDPAYIDSDLSEMADYFSRYPEAVALLTVLKDQPWQLAYSRDTFETEVRGNVIQVKSVKVSFDSRAAAQLRSHRACKESEKRGACIASPADALLHELLHAKSALLESEQFIEQGGMSNVMYPFAHENAVINSENALYKSMTAIDSHYRPSRHAHAGRVVASACVTCVN